MKKNIVVIGIASYLVLLIVCFLIYRNQKVKIVDLQTQLAKQKLVFENPKVTQKPTVKYIERRVDVDKIPDNIKEIIAKNESLSSLLEAFREKEFVVEGERIVEPSYPPVEVPAPQRDNKFSIVALSPLGYEWSSGWYVGVGYKIIEYPDISLGAGWEFDKVGKTRVFGMLRF